MKHNWDYSKSNSLKHGTAFRNIRICLNCKAEQEKIQSHSWGRVVGSSWWPLAGRCKPTPMEINSKEQTDGN